MLAMKTPLIRRQSRRREKQSFGACPMKRLTQFITICMMCVACSVFAQTHTQSISFDDGVGPGNAGTYGSNDHFSVDLYLTYSGYNSYGFSLWMETTAAAAPYLTLTGMTNNTTFPDLNPFLTFPQAFTLLQSNGMYTTPNSPDGGPSDIGSTVSNPQAGSVPPGTYFVGQLSVALNGLPPGVYVMRTDALGGHTSEVVDTKFMDNNIPVSEYTITVVPEPSTMALLGVAAIVLVLSARRRTGLRRLTN